MAKGGAALLIATMILGVLMDGIDGSIVNVALPSIAHGFGTDTSVVSWVTISYFLMLAGLLLPFGRIADAGHIRKVFLLGFVVFTAGSLACALSPSLSLLIVSRIVQGVGAAALAAVAPMICVKLLPPEHLGRSLGIMSVAAALGFALGPALGGFLVGMLSWHWIFLINIPIGVLGVILGHMSLPREETTEVSVDIKGTILLFAAVGFGVIALERVSYPDERLFCIVCALLTVVMLALFVRLFRIRDLDLTLLSYTLINLVYMGVLYILPFYMDLELGLTSIQSGVILFLPSVVSLILNIPVGNYSDKHGRRTFAVIATVFGIVYSVIMYVIEPEMGLTPLIAVALCMGLVWGFCGAASSGRIVDSLEQKDKAIGSSMMTFFLYVGSTVGTALFASLLTSGAGAGGIPIEELTSEAFMSGSSYAMIWAIALSVISLVAAWAVDERKRNAAKSASGDAS